MRTLLTFFCFMLMFSPVGNAKLVYDSIYTGIFVIDDDGSNVTRLDKKSSAGNPRWSPDGKQIVYSRYNGNDNKPSFYITIMNADGTDLWKLTHPDQGSEADYYPSFSPDGKQILFIRYKNGQSSLNILDLETGQIRQITDMSVRYPEWSPVGEHIAFTHGGYIWTIDTDGNNARQLLPTQQDVEKTVQGFPRWSPDGQQILFTQSEYITQQIGKVKDIIHIAHRYMICDRNGENIQELQIPKNLDPAGIDWMDNSESVVFCANKTELNKIIFEVILDYTIYKYHIPTKKMTQIGDDELYGYSIDWVSGSALSVTPKGKMQTRWGEIKKTYLGSEEE